MSTNFELWLGGWSNRIKFPPIFANQTWVEEFCEGFAGIDRAVHLVYTAEMILPSWFSGFSEAILRVRSDHDDQGIVESNKCIELCAIALEDAIFFILDCQWKSGPIFSNCKLCYGDLTPTFYSTTLPKIFFENLKSWCPIGIVYSPFQVPRLSFGVLSFILYILYTLGCKGPQTGCCCWPPGWRPVILLGFLREGGNWKP